MTSHPNERLLKFLRTAAPVAILCVVTSLPAAAVTINASPGSGATAATSTQATKAALKAQKKADKRARKACKKAMKQARKQGIANFSCNPGTAAPAAETVAGGPPAANPQQATSNDSAAEPAQPSAAPPGQGGSQAPSSGASTPSSSKPPASDNPATPPAPPAPANGGETDGVIRNALTGPESIPSGFLDPPGNAQGNEPPAFLAAVPPTQSVPEPGSLALLGTGLVGLALAARRRKSAV